jgi:UDP-glucuronate 4-epimerase
MKILITGCAGFIGSNLVDYLLNEGHKIVGIDNFDDFYSKDIKIANLQNANQNENFTFFEIDILDQKSLFELKNNYDAIIHLAAKAGVRPSLENPSLYQRVNVEGTQNVINLATECSVNKIVFASSSSVYGINENLPWKESDLNLMPISPYASSKISGEFLGKTFANIYNKTFISLRFFTVYGPRQRPDLAINKFFKKIQNNEVIELFGDGSSIRDYTYISDLIDGIYAAILNDKLLGYNVFNLGSGSPIKLIEMIYAIEIILDKKAKIKYLDMQTGDAPKTFSDNSSSRCFLNYTPKISFNIGLKYYLKHLEYKQ